VVKLLGPTLLIAIRGLWSGIFARKLKDLAGSMWGCVYDISTLLRDLAGSGEGVWMRHIHNEIRSSSSNRKKASRRASQVSFIRILLITRDIGGTLKTYVVIPSVFNHKDYLILLL
jgi:hypothetical protein